MSLIGDIKSLFPDAKESQGYCRVRCPYHKGGMERKPSMSILVEDRSKENKKLVEGYARCFTCNWEGSFAVIAEDFGLQYVPDATEVVSGNRPTFSLHLQKATLKKDTPYLFSPYLAGRGISEEVQKLFKVYQKDDENKVYMPVFSRDGAYLYNCSRSTTTKAFFVEGGKHKSLAYIEEVDFGKPIAVVEGQIDAMTFYAAEFCRATATLGAANADSVSVLKSATGPFLLGFDTDTASSKYAGQRATRKAIEILGVYKCKVIKFAVGEDANKLWISCGFDSSLFAAEIEERLISAAEWLREIPREES